MTNENVLGVLRQFELFFALFIGLLSKMNSASREESDDEKLCAVSIIFLVAAVCLEVCSSDTKDVTMLNIMTG